MISDQFFYDFGSPMLVDTWPYDASFTTYGGGGATGTIGLGFDWGNVTIGMPVGGSSVARPDVKRILTNLANTIEAQLQANLSAWQQQQINSDQALQRAWSLMDQFTNTAIRYGPQGQVSAEERDRRLGSPRLRWDWIGYYIDPISQAAGAPANRPIEGGGLPGAGGMGPVYAGIGSRSTATWLMLIGAIALVIILKRT